MRSPPEILTGARVLHFASLAKSQPTGKTRHVVGGVEVKQFAALAITRYDTEPHCVYLFYCDPSWNVITDTWHQDVAAAIDRSTKPTSSSG